MCGVRGRSGGFLAISFSDYLSIFFGVSLIVSFSLEILFLESFPG